MFERLFPPASRTQAAATADPSAFALGGALLLRCGRWRSAPYVLPKRTVDHSGADLCLKPIEAAKLRAPAEALERHAPARLKWQILRESRL